MEEKTYMEQKKKAFDRITVIIRDQLGSPYGIVALSRESIVEATYVTTTGILQLVLASTQMQGSSDLKWGPITKAKKMPDGQISVSETGGHKQEMYFNIEAQHNMLNVADESDIRRIWEWINTDMPADKLFEMRVEALRLLEEFKQKKQAEQEKKLADTLLEKDASAGKEESQTLMKAVPKTTPAQ